MHSMPYAMLVSLGVTKLMAQKLMTDYPEHQTAAQAIVDFTTDGESDIRGAITRVDEEKPRRRERGGAT
jgi:hypothetical protein